MKFRHLLLAATLGAIAAPAANAQIGGLGGLNDRLRNRTPGPVSSPTSTVLAKRVLGNWKGSAEGGAALVVDVQNGPNGEVIAYVAATNAGSTRRVQATLQPTASGDALEGDWQGNWRAQNSIGSGRWRLSIKAGQLVLTELQNSELFARATIDRGTPKNWPDAPAFAQWTGNWTVPGGTLTLVEEDKQLYGAVRVRRPNGLAEVVREMIFSPAAVDTTDARDDTLVGTWQASGGATFAGGRARMTLLPGKQAFGGTLEGDPDFAVWKGSRVAGEPQSDSPNPTPGSPADPAPSPAPGAPSAPSPSNPSVPSPPPQTQPAGAFKPLAKWDVRVDRVEMPRDDQLVHVYLTFRNPGGQKLLQTEGVYVQLEDSEGVVRESGQSLRPVPGYPQLFGTSPAVMPGRELQVKFVFDRAKGTRPVRVTVVEGDKTAEFTSS